MTADREAGSRRRHHLDEPRSSEGTGRSKGGGRQNNGGLRQRGRGRTRYPGVDARYTTATTSKARAMVMEGGA
jgi:hypothetical protein